MYRKTLDVAAWQGEVGSSHKLLVRRDDVMVKYRAMY
jgi:hypothetical protein